MSTKALGSSFDFAATCGPGDAEPLLQILFVADEDVDVLDDAAEDRHGAIGAAGGAPQLLAVVQVERHDRARAPSPPSWPR